MRKLTHSTEQPKVFNSPDIINHTICWDDDDEEYYDDEEDCDWDEEDDIISEPEIPLNVYSNRLNTHRHDLSYTNIQKPTYEELMRKIDGLEKEISELEDARDDAYSDGHTHGYQEGKGEGYSEGYDEGYREGYDDAQNDIEY